MSASIPRIALTTHALNAGGVSTFLFRLGRYLARRGWSVDLVTTERPGDWFDLASSYGLEAHHLPGSEVTSRIAHARTVGDYLVDGQYEAILLNHSGPAQLGLGLLPDSVFAVPFVHRDDEPVYATACSNRHAWNCLVTPGPKLFTEAQHRVPDRPVVLIPHGVPVPEEDALQIDRRAGKPLRIAFVGRLDDSNKGLSVLLEILSRLGDRGIDCDLRIAGEGPDEPLLRERVEGKGFETRVEFLGTLKPLDVYRLLLDSHVLLMPSSRAGSGVVALEAQACGCVPIVTELPGVTDAIVQDGRTGFLIPSEQADRFADAVASCAHDRVGWTQMARSGHRAVSKQFPLEQMGQAYRQLFVAGIGGQHRLSRPRVWRPGVDLEALPGGGFIPEAIRRLARWLRRRRSV